ncbi:MAG: dephospho-CoA kinase [Actinobacteria bacterium HGW-Actinobacteria-1]|nr:MAG: dephospho-CoA kinase [Actinobacteria bacterium HGW-Actinobacteria-1]
MYVLALTGGIGSGKSTASEYFASLGAVVLDLDDIAKRLLEPEMPMHAAVVEVLGPEILAADGRIDTAALAERAFVSPATAKMLNDAVHPAVYNVVAGALDALALQAEPPRFVVLDVPLLAESPEFADLADAVLALSSDEDARIDRLVARGMAEHDAERRMACQASDAERRDIADYVIENDGDLLDFRAALSQFFEEEVAPRVA